MATVPELEMGLNPWPVSSFAFSGLCGTAPDENGARAQTYEWLFVWWSDTITNWVTQLTGSQSDAQFDSCMFFRVSVCLFHTFLVYLVLLFSCFPPMFMLQWKDKWCLNVNAGVIIFFTADIIWTHISFVWIIAVALINGVYMRVILLSSASLFLSSGLLGCGWRVIRFSRGLRSSYNAYQWQQSGRLVLVGQRGQRAVKEPGTAKPDADWQ